MTEPKTPTGNPDFNMARGAATMTAAPPFDFQDVILRVFPLRADIHALRLFCDRFLNIAPDYVLFEPSAPYVIVETINYGKMSPEASNFGWVSQNEVVFAILLNWYEIKDGKPVFRDTASVCPFIFVDEETSVRGGREVFGWPKSLAWLTPGIDAWARDPRSPRTLFTLSAMVFPELFAGQRQETQVLFEIEQEPPVSAAEFPINPFNELNPMANLPRTVMNSMKMAGDMVQNMMGLPIQGFPLPNLGGRPGRKVKGVAGTDFRTAPPWEMLRNALGGMNPFAQLPVSNTINLKQFRDSSRPEEICYQALVNAKMTIKSVKRGGLLGQQAMALGDPSGGYSLKIHRSPAWPIIESLGLEVASESNEHGRRVATLKPVLPNWMENDFHYGRGEVLCWRSLQTDWAPPPPQAVVPLKPGMIDGLGTAQIGTLNKAEIKTVQDLLRSESFHKELKGVSAEDAVGMRKQAGDLVFSCPPPRPREASELELPGCGEPHRFNTARGGSLDQVRGPFYFNDVTMRVLPLLADETKLQQFADKYLNGRESKFDYFDAVGHTGKWHLRETEKPTVGLPMNMFRAWGNYVYLIVTNFGEVTSDLNVGWWARRQVSFAFPVKWYRLSERDKEWKLLSSALVSPYVYADSSVAATTGRELQGRPVTRAEIEASPTSWLDEAGPAKPEDLLSLTTGVYPALNVGQRIENRLLLEVTGRDALPEADRKSWEQVAAGWGETLVKELKRKTEAPECDEGLAAIKPLALELLTGRRPVNHISLKQFRDAEDPHTACYQAITLSPETLARVHDLREIDDRLHVAIHRYPSQPIVETLGLEVKRTDSAHESVVDYLQPIRPFWLQADIEAHLGEDVFWRAGSSRWEHSHERWVAKPFYPNEFEEAAEDPDPPYFERMEPRRFSSWMPAWIESEPENRQSLQDLVSALAAEKTERFRERVAEDSENCLVKMEAELAGRAKGELKHEKHLNFLAANLRANQIEGSGVTPQAGLESILSNEWLHFGQPRWGQREAAKKSEFERRMNELARAKLPELHSRLKDKGIRPERLEEELQTRERGAPPLKKDFIIRRDTIGHPETRADFEKDYHLDRLDDDYWYWLPEKEKEKRLEVRRLKAEICGKPFVEARVKELENLSARLDQQLERFDRLEVSKWKKRKGRNWMEGDWDWPAVAEKLEAEIKPVRKERERLDLLEEVIKNREHSAQKSGDYYGEYVQIQKLVEGARAAVEDAEKTVDSAEREAGRPAPKDGDSKAGARLKPGMISGLADERIGRLNKAGIQTVEDLLARKDFHKLLDYVGERTEEKMRKDAEKFLGKRAKRKR